MAGTRGSAFFDYKKLLAKPLQTDPLWRALGDACNVVLNREIDERRRRLSSSRDSVKNRRGDILSQLKYLPESGKPAIYQDTGEVVDSLNQGDYVAKAIITQVINQGSYFGEPDQVDYFQVEWKENGRTVQWLLPTQAPQERSLLLSNSYAMGFDFFNTKLSNKDYQRLYEYLGMFWPEDGFSDTFIQFIGFIKNLKLSGLPLWSQDNGTDTMTILEEDDPINQPHASKGGNWFLTSHVEMRIDVGEQNLNYPIDLAELEELFYLFAPVILVLERISFEINANNINLFAVALGTLRFYDAGLIDKSTNATKKSYIGVRGSLCYSDAGYLKYAP